MLPIQQANEVLTLALEIKIALNTLRLLVENDPTGKEGELTDLIKPYYPFGEDLDVVCSNLRLWHDQIQEQVDSPEPIAKAALLNPVEVMQIEITLRATRRLADYGYFNINTCGDDSRWSKEEHFAMQAIARNPPTDWHISYTVSDRVYGWAVTKG